MNGMVQTAGTKRSQQAAGVAYGCHVDLCDGEQPDGCVLDDGNPGGCDYALTRRKRETCQFWQPVTAKVTARGVS